MTTSLILIAAVLALTGYGVLLSTFVRGDGRTTFLTGRGAAFREPPRSHPVDPFGARFA